VKGRASAAIVVLAGVASAVAAGAPPVVLAASGLPLTEFNCYNPFQANADFEAYGPTDVNVQAGNGRVTVNENDHGTITVFKYPNPSYYNQVKYFGLSRNHTTGAVGAQFPNEGSFAGIVYHTSGGTGFNWLRDWQVTQQYDSQDVPVPVSVYHAPANLGLTVTDVDLTPPGLGAARVGLGGHFRQPRLLRELQPGGQPHHLPAHHRLVPDQAERPAGDV